MTADESAAFEALARRHGLPAVQLGAMQIEPEAIARVPRHLVERHRVMPVAVLENVLVLAMIDPANLAAVDDVSFVTRLRIEPVVTTEVELARAIAKHYL